MTRQQLLKKYETLSARARRQVDALVSSLTKAPIRKPGRASDAAKSIADEPFVGMWRDRPEMSDGVEWVKSLRRRQWSRRVG